MDGVDDLGAVDALELYDFTNTMTLAEAEAAYYRHQVPDPGRMIFQAAFANFSPRAVNKADFHNDDSAPLLVSETTRITRYRPRSAGTAKRLGKSNAVVDYKQFAGRPHLAGAPGWEAVADYALDWADRHTGATTSSS